MKECNAKLMFLRKSPRKVQEVAGLIRGRKAIEALQKLSFSPRAPAEPLKKLLVSALSNGGYDPNAIPANVIVHEIFVNQGPIMKRWIPRAQGRATPLYKRTSHVYLTLREKVF